MKIQDFYNESAFVRSAYEQKYSPKWALSQWQYDPN